MAKIFDGLLPSCIHFIFDPTIIPSVVWYLKSIGSLLNSNSTRSPLLTVCWFPMPLFMTGVHSAFDLLLFLCCIRGPVLLLMS